MIYSAFLSISDFFGTGLINNNARMNILIKANNRMNKKSTNAK
jgi:hypothetical protein